jgi:hypothetical protein
MQMMNHKLNQEAITPEGKAKLSRETSAETCQNKLKKARKFLTLKWLKKIRKQAKMKLNLKLQTL